MRIPRIPVLACLCAIPLACDSESPGGPDDPGGLPDAVAENLASSAGDFATDFLRDAPYASLVVEVDWVAGHEPSVSALDGLAAKLEELCRKPGGVEIVLDDEIPAQGSPVWSVETAELLELEWRDSWRDAETGTAVMYFLYLDGSSDRDSGSSRILGYAVHGSSLVIFEETIDELGGGLALLADPESVVLLHEAGHVLGLVNNGVPMRSPHEDAAHRGHDADDTCLMYWAIETSDIVDILLQRVPDFDAACREDLVAAGGRE